MRYFLTFAFVICFWGCKKEYSVRAYQKADSLIQYVDSLSDKNNIFQNRHTHKGTLAEQAHQNLKKAASFRIALIENRDIRASAVQKNHLQRKEELQSLREVW